MAYFVGSDFINQRLKARAEQINACGEEGCGRFKGFNSEQKQTIIDSEKIAKAMLESILKKLDKGINDPDSFHSEYITFGSSKDKLEALKKLKEDYLKIVHYFETSSLNYTLNPEFNFIENFFGVDSGFASVYSIQTPSSDPNRSNNLFSFNDIHINTNNINDFYQQGETEQARLIIHEASHIAIASDDNQYLRYLDENNKVSFWNTWDEKVNVEIQTENADTISLIAYEAYMENK